jgi:hypothetical protein
VRSFYSGFTGYFTAVCVGDAVFPRDAVEAVTCPSEGDCDGASLDYQSVERYLNPFELHIKRQLMAGLSMYWTVLRPSRKRDIDSITLYKTNQRFVLQSLAPQAHRQS